MQSAVGLDALTHIESFAMANPLVAQTTLNDAFAATRGLSATFREEGKAQFQQKFPPIAHAVAELTSAELPNVLRHPWNRRAYSNAWFVNLLVVPPGASVARHIDATLGRDVGDAHVPPAAVAVLYINDCGTNAGQLELYPRNRVLRIAPQRGRLLVFRGDMAHAVTVNASKGVRLSLVAEHYVLPQSALKQVPHYRLETRGLFAERLQSVGNQLHPPLSP